MLEALADYNDELLHRYLESHELPVELIVRGDPPGNARGPDHPGALRFGVQEQGSAAASSTR